MTAKKTTTNQALTGEGTFNPAAAMVDAASGPFGLTAANPGGIALAKKQSVLDWIFGNTALAATGDTNYYVGLVTGTYTGGTSDIAILQGTFTGNPEVTTAAWTNYLVATVANAAAQWTAASGVAGTQVATKVNTNAISFSANATVAGTGPTPTGWFIANSATLRAAANIIATGNLTGGSVAVVNGASVQFAAAALSILLT